MIGIFFFISSLVAFANGNKSDNVTIALAEQSKSCLDISSKHEHQKIYIYINKYFFK